MYLVQYLYTNISCPIQHRWYSTRAAAEKFVAVLRGRPNIAVACFDPDGRSIQL